jgi:hypothetical protein
MRLAALILGLLVLGASIAAQSIPAKPAPLSLERPALLIIDIQNFYFEGGRVPLFGPVEASLEAKAVLESFRTKKLPIIHIQHMPKGIEKFEVGKTDPQYAIHPNVAPAEGETIIVKHYANAFRETDLTEILKKLGVKTLVVTACRPICASKPPPATARTWAMTSSWSTTPAPPAISNSAGPSSRPRPCMRPSWRP